MLSSDLDATVVSDQRLNRLPWITVGRRIEFAGCSPTARRKYTKPESAAYQRQAYPGSIDRSTRLLSVAQHGIGKREPRFGYFTTQYFAHCIWRSATHDVDQSEREVYGRKSRLLPPVFLFLTFPASYGSLHPPLGHVVLPHIPPIT